MGMEELGVLNLADADLSAGDFEPIPAGAYEMHVHEVTAVEVEHDNGKLPMGTAGWNIQFRVDGGKYDNRVVFKRYYLPGPEYDAEKRSKSLGIFANFLIALGYSKEEVTSGSFSAEPSDWVGRQVKVSVKVRAATKVEDGNEKYPAQNEVTSVKALTSGAALGGDAGVL